MRARRLLSLLVLTAGLLAAGSGWTGEQGEIPKPLRDVMTPKPHDIQTTKTNQLCLAFAEFIDTVLLEVRAGGGPATFFSIDARWRGLGIYQLAGGGTLIQNSVDATKEEFPWQLGVSLGNPSSLANGNRVCELNWLFAGGDDFLEGPAELTCTGENPAFTTRGTLFWVPDCLGTEAVSELNARPLPLMLSPQ